MTGHYRYFGMSGNRRMMYKYYQSTSRLVFKWINKRSQKKSCTRAEYANWLERKLPVPRVYHNIYTLYPSV
jgi:hypothetical protein